MILQTIEHPEYLSIHDNAGIISFGADQEWFPMLWQRRAGCGPTTASNLMLYFQQRLHPKRVQKEEAIQLMQEMWKLITPGIMGVHLLSQFTKGFDAYLASTSFELQAHTLKISRAKERRPSLSEVVDFLISSFKADSPVAFLNLSRGSLTNLDEWHWVTLVGIEGEEEGQGVSVTVYDAALSWKIDLGSWLESTTRGGGFISYRPSASQEGR